MNIEQHLETLFTKPFEHLINVNYGGCGRVAVLMSEMLSRYGVDHSIRFISDSSSVSLRRQLETTFNNLDLETNIMTLGKQREQGNCGHLHAPNNHVVIKIGKKLYDSTGDVTEYYTPMEDDLSCGFMKTMLKLPLWNSTFKECNTEEDLESLPYKVEDVFREVLGGSYYENYVDA